MSGNVPNRPVGRPRQIIGFTLLAGYHLFLLAWSAAVAIVSPKYRRLLRFQVRYMRDVLGREITRFRLAQKP